MLSYPDLFIGLMSGTSLDGVDGVLVGFPETGAAAGISMLAAAYVAFPVDLKNDLMRLQAAGDDEIHREAIAGNTLARHYAQCVSQLLSEADIARERIAAIGVHGQTIRHRPESGYTRQAGNPALLAELTGIDVIADFRSRDIAAGGQGAPLVPAFHQAVFSDLDETRVVANIGGISNISILARGPQARIIGFDTGPGNVLMDAWIARHLGKDYDVDGAWGATGRVNIALLGSLRNDPYFQLPPPKSTGRDLFHPAWLDSKLAAHPSLPAADVQATLTAFTASTLADAIASQARDAAGVYVCGGGAYNCFLMGLLQQALAQRGASAKVQSTEDLGVSPNHVEALAFAWLAHRFHRRKPGNMPSVTGAAGERILGALYPA